MTSLHDAHVIKQFAEEFLHITKELESCNIPHNERMEFEKQIASLQAEFEKIQSGGSGSDLKAIEKQLTEYDRAIAKAAIKQAEQEVSKLDQTHAHYQALENIRKEYDAGSLTPSQARHQIKEINREFH